MNAILINQLDVLIDLCKYYKVKSMYAFGSVCTDRFTDQSDIDLLIAFDSISIEQYSDYYFELHYKLQDIFKRDIDLVTEKSLSNPFFVKSIELTKQLIYAA